MTKRFIFSLVLLLFSTNLYAVIDLNGDSADWTVIMNGNQFDIAADQQANSAELELVGGVNLPLLYTQYDDNGTPADTTDDTIAYRARVSGQKTSDYSGGYLFIGFDLDLDNGLDFYISVSGKNTDGGIVGWEPGTDLNISPSTTSIANPTQIEPLDFTTVTGNVAFVPVDADTDPTSVFNSDNFNGADYFINYKLSFTDFKTQAEAKSGITGITPTTAIQYTLATSINPNSYNSDVGGYDDTNNANLAVSYADAGAFSPPLSISNVFPEITSNGGAATAAIAINEASTAVSTVTTTDADGDTVTFSISNEVSVANEDKAGFSIDTNSGELIFVVAPDVSAPTDVGGDNNYQVIVIADDGNSGTDAQAMTVTVNATPDVTAPAAPSVDLLASSDTGSSNSDDITSDTTPAIRVILDQSGAAATIAVDGDVVKLFEGAIQVGTAALVADDITNGYVDISSSALTEGSLSFTATVTDAANNASAASTALAVSLDTTIPVIVLNGLTLLTIERAGGYLEIGATASDNLDGNVTAKIVTVNLVDADTVGIYTVTFDVDDAVGNSAVQVTRTVIVQDTIGPGVSILNQPASVNNLNAFNVTFKFDEVVSGFISTEITVVNATVSNFINVGGIGDIYTADIKPDNFGDVTVAVNANAAQDASSNGNTAALTQITTFDNTPPDVVVTSSPDVNLANQSAYTVSGTCTAGDGDVLVFLSLGPAFFTPFEACTTGGTWSSTFDLSSLNDTDANAVPAFLISIGARQTDAAGNIGDAVAVEVDKDTVKPNVQIQNVPAFVNANEFSISIVFDEDVTGFDSGDIAVTNGAVNVTSFNAVDAQTYTVGITASGDITLNVAANVAQDLVGNDNNAATPAVAVFDIIAPFVIITNATVVNAANAANYTVGGDCDNGDGDVTVSIAGATPASQNDITCTAGSWSAIFDVTAISDGLNALTVNASQTDAATNTGNAIAVQVDKDVLITVPTVNVLATNNLTPVITGTADTDTSNEIVVAGATYTVTAVVGNLWSLDTAVATPVSGTFSLAGGVNDVVVTSTDAAGNSAIDASSNEVTLSLDDDDDGIPNIVECSSGLFDSTCPDADGDGTPDFQETDSDNDSIPDAIEAGNNGDNPIDSDGDGIPDYRDTDSDNDGIDDAVEGAVDTDGDSIPDYVDVGNTGDSDGDGIPDTVECPVYPGCTDTDGDGKPDYLDIDADNDGIGDAVEAGVDPTAPIDTDGDGTPDYQDADSDEDGANDSVEGLTDNDADGIPDYVDAASTGPAPNAGDSDGDGIADNIECELYPLCADSNNDGTPDYMETDSDNDGIPDVNEAGPVLNDADNDGIDDTFDIDITRLINGLDQNGDGIDDTQPLDTDGDGTPDYQDADSDGDGIDDIVECPAGIPCPDADNDGIPDQLDASDGDASGDDITGRGDSDGDGISDIDECIAGVPCSDIDQDGLPDYMDNTPDDGPAGDPDNDAILNYLDPDDDNDRIPDVIEDPDFDMDNNPATNPLDYDLDGTPDYLDLDSDNDGLTDADESGASGNDSDGDNIDDTYDIDLTGGADLNMDGVDDDVTPRDTDSDNLPDYLDTVFDGVSGTADTDKDGILDDVECPLFPTDCPDSDNDGTPDFLETDSDGDGLGDDEEAGSLSSGILLDTDGDGVPDYQDTDSDNDGVSDSVEGLSADNDADGIPDALDADSSGAPFGGDSDGDGVVDIDECNTYPDCADSNNDGTPDYMDSSYRPYDPNAKINTGLNGVGSNGPWILLLIPVTLLIRRKIR